jgi:hypothetical protein
LKLPRELWAALAAVVLAWTLIAGVRGYGASRYADGRRSVTDGVRFDTVLVGQVRKADSIAKASTDKIVPRIVVTRWKVDTLIREVPDTLHAVPQIKALVVATLTLTAQVDTLTRTLDVERAVSRLRASTDSAALVSAQLVIIDREDTIVQMKKRPQWRTVGLALGVGVVAGLLR